MNYKNIMLVLVITNLVTLLILGFILFKPPATEESQTPAPSSQAPTEPQLPAEEAEYIRHPGYFDWYETAESQAVLTYQRTSFACFLELLELAIEEALGG